MNTILSYLGLSESSGAGAWISFLVALVLLQLVAALVHRFFIRQLERIVGRTSATWDDELVRGIKKPTGLMVMVIFAYLATQISHFPFKEHAILSAAVRAAFIVFMFWTVERILYALIKGNAVLGNLAESSRILIATVMRVLILVIGLLMVLDSAGISITPLLASLGVGSVAVALALQDTLSNLFSGLYILADKPFQIGDFVEVEGGIQGYVVKVGWRSSHIKTFNNNIVVIPNSKMASAVLTNFDLDDGESVLKIPVGVAYGSDLDKVERVTCQTAKEVLVRMQPNLRTFEPFIRYNAFADSSINFNVFLRTKKYDEYGELRHEFIKALNKAYAENGIDIPFPQRVVHMRSSNV